MKLYDKTLLWTIVFKILFKYILYPNISNPSLSFGTSHNIDIYPWIKYEESFIKFWGVDGKTAANILNAKSLFGTSPFELTAEYWNEYPSSSVSDIYCKFNPLSIISPFINILYFVIAAPFEDVTGR